MSFLFGNILSVTSSDLIWMGIVDLAIVIVFAVWYRPILYVAFDREYARSQNMPTRLIGYLMSALIAVTIVISIRVVGIVLLISLADHARGDRQPPDPLVRTDHGRGFCDRRAGLVRRTLRQLQGRYSVGRVYNIYTDRYAYCCKTITFCVTLCGSGMKTVHASY